jgi:hypothetical protein
MIIVRPINLARDRVGIDHSSSSSGNVGGSVSDGRRRDVLDGPSCDTLGGGSGEFRGSGEESLRSFPFDVVTSGVVGIFSLSFEDILLCVSSLQVLIC